MLTAINQILLYPVYIISFYNKWNNGGKLKKQKQKNTRNNKAKISFKEINVNLYIEGNMENKIIFKTPKMSNNQGLE